MHGYDPANMPEMKAIFFAAGPDIRRGEKVAPFENVNLYPLIAHILGLDIAHLKTGPVDGDLKVLQGILNAAPQRVATRYVHGKRGFLATEMRLSEVAARVLGALVEKEITTPEYYPLSLNALVNACNQKSNREPVMNLDEDAVTRGDAQPERFGIGGRGEYQ